MLRLVCSEQKIIEHNDLGGVCQLNDKCYVVSVLTEFAIFEAALKLSHGLQSRLLAFFLNQNV